MTSQTFDTHLDVSHVDVHHGSRSWRGGLPSNPTVVRSRGTVLGIRLPRHASARLEHSGMASRRRA